MLVRDDGTIVGTIGGGCVEADRAGEQGSRTEVYALNDPPARGDSKKIDDDGNAAQAIFDFLAERRLV